MSSTTDSHWLACLQRVRDAGGEFLNALYVHRSVQRALPGTRGEDVPDAVLEVMEAALTPLFPIDRLRHSLLTEFRGCIEFLVRVDGLTSWDLKVSMIQMLGLVHLLDGVKDNKISIQRDFALYEEMLRKRFMLEENSDKRNELQIKLERCRKLREVFSSRWWFMNGLLVVLPQINKAETVLADLMDLMTRGLCSEEDGSGPVFLPHDRYKLLRSLPVVLYLHHFLCKRIVVTDPIPAKLMDSCFKILKRYPVVPGIGDYAVLLFVPILGILFTPGGPYAKDMKRCTVMSLDEIDRKYLEHLEREYSMAQHHLNVREVHDHMCDALSRFLKESKNWREAGEAMPIQMCGEAVDLSFRILKHLSTWRCQIHELLAWRKSAPTLHESLMIPEDSGYNCIPSRVIRIFNDTDVPLVLETLICVHGLAKFYKQSKHCVVSAVQQWVHQSVRTFMQQTSKKRGTTDVDAEKVFDTITSLKARCLEGRPSNADVQASETVSGDLKFDAACSTSLVKLRRVVEELYFLCSSHPVKNTLSSYICGNPGAVAPGVQKATRELLRQLYLVQEIMKADEHLEKILDFSDLSLREREIEVTGTVQLNRANAVALQLAHGAINSSYGGSLDPVFIALGLFDGASEKLLSVYKSQLIFMELRQAAMEGLEIVLDEICKQALIQAKVQACVTVVNVNPSLWLDEINGVSSRPMYKFDCVFQKKTLCLAGYDVDIQMALVDRLDAMLKSEYGKVFDSLESTIDPTLITSCHTRLEILKAAHNWLASNVSLAPWRFHVEEHEASAATSFFSVVKQCILQKLFQEFNYDMRSKKFKVFHSGNFEPFSFRMSRRPSTPKISFSEMMPGQKENVAVFGYEDICVIDQMLTPSEIELLIADVQSFLIEHLSRFVNLSLPVLFDFIPLELIDLSLSELSMDQELTAIECLSFIMEKFRTDITESSAWVEPLRILEKIGNALIFLHSLQICFLQDQVSSTIQHCTSFRNISNLFSQDSDPMDDFEETDSGNPFELEIRKKKARAQAKPLVKKPSGVQTVRDAVQLMQNWMMEHEKKCPETLNIKNAISAVLFLKTYAQTNEHMLSVSFGDGVLWAACVICKLSQEGHGFERNDWIHEILRLARLDDALMSLQIPNDVRSFLSHAQRTASTWRHLSQLKFFSSDETRRIVEQKTSLRMTEDPPLKGFFGGLERLPSNTRRSALSSISRHMGPLRASMIKNKNLSHVLYGTRSTLTSASLEPYHELGVNRTSVFAQDPAMSLRNSFATLRRSHDGCLNHRHSN